MSGPVHQNKPEQKKKTQKGKDRKKDQQSHKEFAPRSTMMEDLATEAGLEEKQGPNPLGEAVQEGREFNPKNFFQDQRIVKGYMTEQPSLQQKLGPKPDTKPEFFYLLEGMEEVEGEEREKSMSGVADDDEDDED